MTIEQTIARENARLFKPLFDELKCEISALRVEVAALKNQATQNAPAENLILMKDAKARLGVSMPKLKAIIAGGKIKTATPPDGRPKVVETSLNAYIEQLAKGGAA